MTIRQAVTFVIYMQNNEGIIQKHPSYLLEKLKMCQARDVPEVRLDKDNLKLFNEYAKKYGFKWDTARDYCDVPMGDFDSLTGEAKEVSNG